MAEEEGHQVKLHVYDLSQGLARQLSTSFLGKAIEAIWHTGIVAYGTEYYFGGGIQRSPVGTTPYGTPMRVVDLGVTHLSREDFEMYLEEISPRYTAETYSLLTHNCNNFSNEVAEFLVGVTIPDYILQLPNEVMSSPMGALILPMIQQLETTLRAGAVPQAPQFRPSSVAVSANNNNNKPSGGGISSNPVVGGTTSSRGSEGVKSSEQQTQSPRRDPLGDARSRVQEEIGREFTAIMSTGTLHASEAAALATRRVMQRYGHLNVSSPRG